MCWTILDSLIYVRLVLLIHDRREIANKRKKAKKKKKKVLKYSNINLQKKKYV